jgi:protein-S-isoprenylcysteine O-methyltransferase Ste14
MVTFLRHLLSIVILPGTVTVAVPIWIARRNGIAFTAPATTPDVALIAAGVIALAGGLLLFAASLARFVTEGRGTLAPWDPPRRLVVRGPYRYVRNPMISGVIFITVGEAMVLRSMPHAEWALAFVLMNLVWIPLFEEPVLTAMFGDEYREYRRHVRRFIPRLHAYQARHSADV